MKLIELLENSPRRGAGARILGALTKHQDILNSEIKDISLLRLRKVRGIGVGSALWFSQRVKSIDQSLLHPSFKNGDLIAHSKHKIAIDSIRIDNLNVRAKCEVCDAVITPSGWRTL